MSLTAQLTHSQRNRLIKSTRKVGNILGETPTVEDSNVASTSSKPSGSSLRPALSLSSKSTSTGRPSLSLPRLPTAPQVTLPPPSPGLSISSFDTPQRSPLSPGFGPLNRDSPFCPSDSESDVSHQADILRKKLAKLRRTFGENVPVELVTISDGLEVDTTGGIGARRSKSLKKRKSLIPQGKMSVRFTSSCRSKHVICSPDSKSSLKSVQHKASTPTLTHPLARSTSLHSSLRHSPARHSRTTSEFISNVDRDLAFTKLTAQSTSSSSLPPLEPPSKHLMMTHRQGKEWSGEWNADDMAQVVNRLRSLK